MGQFLEFLTDYMKFTEEMINYTILIGDVVEQAIRVNNLEKFKANEVIDEENNEQKKKEKQSLEANNKALTIAQQKLKRRKSESATNRSARPSRRVTLNEKKFTGK